MPYNFVFDDFHVKKLCSRSSSREGQDHSSKKARNSLFPQYKTSIGNNSGSIQDRAVKFARSMGF